MSGPGESDKGEAKSGNTSHLVCLLASLILCFFIIFMLGGALAPRFAASLLGQAVLAAIAALFGWVVGSAVHRQFFAPR